MISMETRSVGVALGGTTVLDGVDLRIEPGTLVAVLGPNGAGKTTLMRCLSGDLAPDTGDVNIDDRDISSVSAAELARLRSVLPQQHRVSFGFTSREIVEMGRAPHGDRDPELVAQAMGATDVNHLADRPFRVLSGGEQARVALARVLVQDTPVVLLDEPTAALDLHHQEHVMSIAAQLAYSGRTVVAIVHDLNLAAAFADRLVLLDHGRVAADGAPADVLDADLVSEVYGIAVTVVDHPARNCPLVVTTTTPTPQETSTSWPPRPINSTQLHSPSSTNATSPR